MHRFGFALGLTLGLLLAATASAQPLRPYKFATVGDKPSSAAEIYYGVALEKGWFAEAGIDFQPVRMLGNVAYPAIASGDIDGSLYAGTAAVAALRGAPLVVAFYDPISAPWSLVVNPKKIKSAADLGSARCVAATGAKSATHVAWAAMIDKAGGNWRTFQAVGTGQPPQFWIEALRSGTADCMLGFDAAWTSAARREGFTSMGYLPDVAPMQTNGLVVSRASLKDPAKRKLTTDVIGVFLRVHDYVLAEQNRPEVAGMVKAWMGSPKDMVAEDYRAAVDELAKLLPPKGVITDNKVLSNLLTAGLRYGIYDAADFRTDPAKVDMIKDGLIDQSMVDEAYARGGPLYRAK
jgi:ABC-type nitrate/sulfonate/bicarbonate transport system substrate-binding protein